MHTSKPFVSPLRWLPLLAIGFATSTLQALDGEAFSRPFLANTPGIDIMALQDRVYYFPANRDPQSETVYLPLRKWDILFTGDRADKPWTPLDEANINHLIPGPFNHIMVYLGKDPVGLAYVAELNTSSFEDAGGLIIFCIGSDFGLLRHPDDRDLHHRRRLSSRWAMRLDAEARAWIREAETALLSRIQSDLAFGFPYQLEFSHSGNLLDPNVYLVDDGFEGGAGCSDYWTTLFEEVAGLCLKGVRMEAHELEAYFRNDPQGMVAYAPASLSPFPQPMTIGSILQLGYRAVPPAPHVHPCDGSTETGIVIPMKIMENRHLEPIPPIEGHLPFRPVVLNPGR